MYLTWQLEGQVILSPMFSSDILVTSTDRVGHQSYFMTLQTAFPYAAHSWLPMNGFLWMASYAGLVLSIQICMKSWEKIE